MAEIKITFAPDNDDLLKEEDPNTIAKRMQAERMGVPIRTKILPKYSQKLESSIPEQASIDK